MVCWEDLIQQGGGALNTWTKYRYGGNSVQIVRLSSIQFGGVGDIFPDTEFPAPQPASGLSFRAMEQATADHFNAAKLSQGERRVVARFASRLIDELGSDLRGLWLYGSRARGA